MGLPIDYHILFMIMSILFFALVILFIFINPDFNKTVAATLLSFLNIVICFITGLGFFSIDLYSFDSQGEIVSNILTDYSELGIVFIGLSYLSLLLLFYCVSLFYSKPWENVNKIEGNPYINYK